MANTGLTAEGLSRPAACHRATHHLPDRWIRAELAGDRHHHDIWSIAVIDLVADDDGGPLLGRGLIGEWKRYENDVAKLIGHR